MLCNSRVKNYSILISEQHSKCLLSMVKRKEYNEYNVQVILAAHLFGPLAGSYKIGNKDFPKDARRCPECKKDITGKLKNTSLGKIKKMCPSCCLSHSIRGRVTKFYRNVGQHV